MAPRAVAPARIPRPSPPSHGKDAAVPQLGVTGPRWRVYSRRAMALPNPLAIALKEWATVCHALETGRQMLLLRKGGIYEAAGEFELENPQFLLFPTYLHQNLA